MSCGCGGYKPLETDSRDTELLMINRNALMDIRDIVEQMEYVTKDLTKVRLERVIRRVGL